MTERDGNGHWRDPGDTDPLLVRPFLGDEVGPSESGQRWPAERYRTIRSHRAEKGAPPPADSTVVSTAVVSPPAAASISAAKKRKRHPVLLAGASAAAVLGFAAVGYGVFRPAADPGAGPLPVGALPPLSSPDPSTIGTDAPGGTTLLPDAAGTTRPGDARNSPASPGATSRTSPADGATTPAVPGGAASPTDAPSAENRPAVPLPPALEAALAPPPAARVGTITAESNLCLDLNGGVPFDNNHVQVFDCNGTGAQLWTMATDGTLQVAGKCAQVTGDTTIHIIGCDRRETAQWRAGADESLVNVATGQCLTDAENRSGAGVRVDTCDGRDDQQWSLPR